MAERSFAIAVPNGIETPSITDLLTRVAPQLVIVAWRELAADQVDTGDYLARLTLQEALHYPYAGDADAAAVINTAFHAEFLENGRAGFHLPSRIRKWRQGVNGNLFVRVAFRSSTPPKAGEGPSTSRLRQVMPAAVLLRARRLEHGQRLTGFGDTYKQSKSYNYYGQIEQDFPELLSGVDGYTWAASRYEGLFQAGERTTPGGGTQSEYLTIRTITPESLGWYIPSTPAHHYAERALARAAPLIQDLADKAAAQDITAAVVRATAGLVA